MNFYTIFKNFLKNADALSNDESVYLKKEIKNMIKTVAARISFKGFVYTSDDTEQICDDVLIRLYERREMLLSCMSFSENGGLKSYIYKVIRSVILNRERKHVIKTSNINEETDIGEFGYLKVILIIEAKEFVESLKKHLAKNDVYALCYYLFRENPLHKNVNALDKAVSRLKVRLQNIVSKEGFSQDAVSYAFHNMIWSEFCKDKGLN